MENKNPRRMSVFGTIAATLTLSLVVPLTLLLAGVQSAQAQTFRVIYALNEFYGSGLFPFAGVTIDGAGNLYVTTKEGGGYNAVGTVFELLANSSARTYSSVYTFRGGSDGAYPYDRVVIGPDGGLYGATAGGAGECQGYGCGTIFSLKPPVTSRDLMWKEKVLYRFKGGSDGAVPYSGDLVFDRAGHLYGTTLYGGAEGCYGVGCGTVFMLTPSDGGWTKNTIHVFVGPPDHGTAPTSGVVFDKGGNLYGTARGVVYQLAPSASGWTEKILYDTHACTFGGLVFDQDGNLYGTTCGDGGPDGGGTVFRLRPSNGSWTYTLLHQFSGSGYGPISSLTLDRAGNLYGTTYRNGAYGAGSVFKLTRSGRSWTYTSLYDFTGGNDGCYPAGSVALDANGNIYGTTEWGGMYGGGVVWEIMP